MLLGSDLRVFACVSGRLRCVFGASWSISERLGAVLEQFWRCLGGVLEHLWSDMELLWSFLEHLGASWGRLGAVLEVSRRRLGALVERHGGALELLINFQPI